MLEIELDSLPRLIADAAEPLPDIERWSHYSEAILPRQFDGWVWFDETNAVTPLADEARPGEHVETEETYPFGL